MVIDFHTHYFPDTVAEKAIEKLSEMGSVKPFGKGTLSSLIEYMKQDQVDFSINQPVATKESQVIEINRKMIETNKKQKKVICFGSMHPEFHKVGSVKEELEYIAAHGIKGIKLHPEYQTFYPDDPSMAVVYETCAHLGLIITFHSGKDIAFPTVHATPRRLAEVAKVKSLKLVLGHLGGYQMWNDVEQYIMGINDIYLDTAFTLEMENWQMKEIIFGHGTYNILLGSDFPWQRASDTIAKIKELGMGNLVEAQICGLNAKNLLNLG